MILITNKKFLNHDSLEINRLIMLHVTKKCWRPFYTDKRQTWEGDVRNFRWAGQSIPENGWAFLIPLPKKKILCKLKQLNSWTGDKQFSPAIVWQLSTATSAGSLHFFIRFSKRSVVCHHGSHYGSCRYLIYYWFTIRFSVWSLLMRTYKFNH